MNRCFLGGLEQDSGLEKGWDIPFQVTEVTSLRIRLFSKDRKVELRKDISSLHTYFLASEYFLCDNCRRNERKENIPNCQSCQERSHSFDGGYELPRFCEVPYAYGFVPLDEPTWATATHASMPTRFERDPVI